MVFGTNCIWDIWCLGQISVFWDIFGTKGIGTKYQWDNSPRDKMYLGLLVFGTIHFFLGQICVGTKGLGTKCQWDNSPRGKGSVGQFS